MKKIIIFVSSIAVMFSLVACGKKVVNENPEMKSNTVQSGIKAEKLNEFIGVVSKIDGKSMLVVPDKDQDIRSSGDLVDIFVSDDMKDIKVGDRIKVIYKGGVMESYPLQVNVVKVEYIESTESLDNEDLDKGVSISKDADKSKFVDWKDVLKDSIGEDVTLLLDEYEVKDGSIKVGDSAGVMLSGLMVEGYEWKIDIEDESVIKFLKMGYEKGVIGERQGFDFFAFKGIKKGEAKINIKIVEKSTGKISSNYEFIVKVVK